MAHLSKEPWPDGITPEEGGITSHGNAGHDVNEGHFSFSHVSAPAHLPKSLPLRERPKMGCPVFVYEKSQNRPHSCNGVTAQTMSEVRRHLIRTQAGRKPHLQFLKRCPTCNTDIVSEHEFMTRHGALCHDAQPLRRGDHATLEQWVHLYRKLYPDADRVPTPWIGVQGFLPELASSNAQPDHDMIATSPFLDAQRNTADRMINDCDLQYVGYGLEHPSGLSRTALRQTYSISIGDDDDDDDTTSFTRRQAESLTQPHASGSSEQHPPLNSHSLAALGAKGPTTFPMENWLQGHDPWPSHPRTPEIDAYLLSLRPIHTSSATNPEPLAPTTPREMPNVQSLLPPTSETPADLLCPTCSQRFVGTYRRGNLGRHIREKHQTATHGPYACAVEGCGRVYRRQDARLKHVRKRHPEVGLPPVQRRRVE